MTPTLKDFDFTCAYEFADRVVRAVFAIPEEEFCIQDYFDGDPVSFAKKISKPCKDTLLHEFIRGLNLSDFDYATGHFPEETTEELAALLASAGLDRPRWLTQESIRSHIPELDRLVKKAAPRVADATFHILFADRHFLFYFQQIISDRVHELDYSSHSDILDRQGVVRRANNLPQWLKRAIFHRDKGHCQRCLKDLTGIWATNDDLRIDHMLPLSQGGTNDPTNFQLLCGRCNLEKADKCVFDWQKTFTYW